MRDALSDAKRRARPAILPLQSYFGQAQTGALNDPLLMQAQVPFRNAGGMPAGFGVAPPSANLFSSIVLPDAGLTMGTGGVDDSGDSSGGGGVGNAGGKKSAEQRAAAVQEKNRRAQKRFRERQVGCDHTGILTHRLVANYLSFDMH